MGKSYQRALSGVTVAAKGYFDALVKLGELASDSQGSKELGDTLFQMAEVHRQIQVQLEETVTENRTLPRSGVRAEQRRVQAVFSHAPGESSTLLNFQEGDVIALLVAEARDGWHYGENEATHMKGWFPFSYTRPVPPAETPEKPHGR
ncbi:Brain-specific angiogenesis inhibitor 1-associated protein 2 [Chelonia mydas]|uniref:Brain-specific angiogenesis inhibitor 1-associated protein 2 n=1 Tax=Chelonia mydas TaxID=8469 RepID=M7BXT6_CHEMY|nr:Brain-specific angiogenesis inhibitor 1-associated protein 2 [Chelonia mydas]